MLGWGEPKIKNRPERWICLGLVLFSFNLIYGKILRVTSITISGRRSLNLWEVVSQRSPLGTGTFIFASRYLIRVILQSRSQCSWCTSFSKQNTIVDSVRKLKLQIFSRRFMSSLEVAPVCSLMCQTAVYFFVVVMLSYGRLFTLVNSNICFLFCYF